MSSCIAGDERGTHTVIVIYIAHVLGHVPYSHIVVWEFFDYSINYFGTEAEFDGRASSCDIPLAHHWNLEEKLHNRISPLARQFV